MESRALTEHAQRVARQVVAEGYADLQLTKQHFDDYFYYRSLGFAGSFTSLLLARKVIDQDCVEFLNKACPPIAETQSEGRMSSSVFSVEDRVAKARASIERARLEGGPLDQEVDDAPASSSSAPEEAPSDPVEASTDEERSARSEERRQPGSLTDEETLIFEDTDPPENRELEVGSYVGEFLIEKILGEGAMGVVFEVSRQDGTVLALKVIRLSPFGDNETRRERFRREVKAMQRLEHPNIISVRGYGREGPYDWYAMDRIEGHDLAFLLTLDTQVEERLDLFEQLCSAIVHAHERGVIHRDLKPSNAVVDGDGRLHVLDFGLAKLADPAEGEGALTRSDVSLGTPYYMSPEQISNPRLVTPRSDIFSLGVILFELVTGQRPFETTTGNRAWEDPPVPSEVNPGLDPAFDRMILKALELKPEDRQASATELLEELRRQRRGEDTQAPSAGRPGLRLLIGLLVVLGLVLVGVVLAAQGHLSR